MLFLRCNIDLEWRCRKRCSRRMFAGIFKEVEEDEIADLGVDLWGLCCLVFGLVIRGGGYVTHCENLNCR
jgi:hypothetical protein